MGVQVMFVMILMSAATVKSQQGDATFWRDKVTLTCPSEGTWHNPTNEVQNKTKSYEFEFTKKKYQFYCKYEDTDDEIKYFFHVEGKACKDCFEVDGLLFLLIIIVDLIGTSVLMMIVYKCTKKKVPEQRPQPRPKPGGRVPPVPAADYEQLNPNSDSATYSAVVIRST